MDSKRVKDLMVPLDEYPTVGEGATLVEAIDALDQAQKILPPGRQPYRAVLVVNANRKVIGKIGQLALLNALEPRYNVLGDLGKLSQAGVSSEFIDSMMDHLRLFQDDLSVLCARAGTLKVTDVMHPVTESIAEDAPLKEAINKLVTLQTLSLLVTRGKDVVGLIRLSELADEIASQIKQFST